MGAAAVFETAAETPPTVDKRLATEKPGFFVLDVDSCGRDANRNGDGWSWSMRMRRTQEVDHEALLSSLANVVGCEPERSS